MKQDKFLWGIVGGTLLLVIAAVAITLPMQRQAHSIPDDTPEGVAYNYFLALQQDDQRKAYEYLSARVKTRAQNPDALLFRSYRSEDNMRLRVDEVNITGKGARLKVTQFSYANTGLFGGRSEYASSNTVNLVHEDGAWKIDRFFYLYWDSGWN